MAASFDALLQADRQKRKNEQLANQLLGNGRRSSTPSNGIRKSGAGGSLASRIIVANRSFSATPKTHATLKNSANAHTQHVSDAALPQNPRPIRANPMMRKVQKERLSENLTKMDWVSNANGQANVRDGGDISILGAAGPYTVVGSNFAPGTTAADIESAMAPIGGEMLGCQITSQKPTVVAEMVFSEKARAENVIATFNNKRADGRLLHVYLKVGKPTSPAKPLSHELPHNSEYAPKETPRDDLLFTETPSSEPPRNAPSEPKAARIDLTYEENSYSKQREQSDRNRRRAEPEFQDGSYGFEKKEDRMEVDSDDRRGFYNDRQRHYGRGRDSGRPRESERRLYSDDLYPRPPRGRGFR
ncbi:MAG: hypothetical protein LQ343_001021 [Gyalolechia ehrenbergii]|nr:MAG: hypothetical protein LQ343_001021 [Gyalolechia ehrenbergii]